MKNEQNQAKNKKPVFEQLRIIWKMLLPTLKPLWGGYAAIVVLVILIALVNALEPYIYGQIVDRIIAAVSAQKTVVEGFQSVTQLLFIWGGLALASLMMVGFYSWLKWQWGNELSTNFAVSFFSKILEHDLRKFRDARGGEVQRRFSNSSDSTWQASYFVSNALLMPFVVLIVATVVGLWLNVYLALLTLVFVVVVVGFNVFGLMRLHLRQVELEDHWMETHSLAGDAILNIASVKAYANEKYSQKVVRDSFTDVVMAQMKLNRLWAINDAVFDTVASISRLVVFTAGAGMVFKGLISPGQLLMFLGLSVQITSSATQLASVLPGVSREISKLTSVAEFWNEIPAVKDVAGARLLLKTKGEVEFHQVHFAYEGKREVLKGVNFKIPAGKMVALVGESGAGKSTVATLMPRFADPTSGSITIDGKDIRDYTLVSLRPKIGFVMQENMLFHDTIFKNIAFAKPGASMNEVMAAAKQAQAHEFISRLPQGYKSVVGERGVKLSGGERQRIALARVFLANPPILVLDEATSALDSVTEAALQKALRAATTGRTSLVIAHRLSTVAHADEILVMHRGEIVDRGRHEDLLKRDSMYRRFWEIQAGGYMEEKSE